MECGECKDPHKTAPKQNPATFTSLPRRHPHPTPFFCLGLVDLMQAFSWPNFPSFFSFNKWIQHKNLSVGDSGTGELMCTRVCLHYMCWNHIDYFYFLKAHLKDFYGYRSIFFSCSHTPLGRSQMPNQTDEAIIVCCLLDINNSDCNNVKLFIKFKPWTPNFNQCFYTMWRKVNINERLSETLDNQK